jgi:hypothetical protein
MKREAQRIATEGDAGGLGDDSAPPATGDVPADVSETAAGKTRVGPEAVEVQGHLVRFDCTGGHRFMVVAHGVTYTLNIVDLNRVLIRENGEIAGARDFYCGPLDELVIARFIPSPATSGASERSGRLVAIDFIGQQ